MALASMSPQFPIIRATRDVNSNRLGGRAIRAIILEDLSRGSAVRDPSNPRNNVPAPLATVDDGINRQFLPHCSKLLGASIHFAF